MEDLHPNFGPHVPLVKEGMMQGHGEGGKQMPVFGHQLVHLLPDPIVRLHEEVQTWRFFPFHFRGLDEVESSSNVLS